MIFPKRYIARIVVKAETPLAIGGNSLLYDQDAPVVRDFNGLPYIPATAIAGFLRTKLATSGMDGDAFKTIFGDDPLDDADQGTGSGLIISDAYLMNAEGRVYQQLFDYRKDEYLQNFEYLPIRQHVAISHLGTAKDGSLFDRELVYKGARFKFEIALELPRASEINNENWEKILNAFQGNDFYLGSGQFNNFGELKCLSIRKAYYDLTKETELAAYLKNTVDVNGKLADADEIPLSEIEPAEVLQQEILVLDGSNSFFHFGSGYGDAEVDHTNYKERVIVWEGGKPIFKEYHVIPGTSIKGALAHRVAYYYNQLTGQTVESLFDDLARQLMERWNAHLDLEDFELAEDLKTLTEQKEQLEKEQKRLNELIPELEDDCDFSPYLGVQNEAVRTLFGSAKGDISELEGSAGSIIIKDVYLSEDDVDQVVFTHNKIDRFTGGTVDTALYSERVLALKEKLNLTIKFQKPPKGEILEAWQSALEDLMSGNMPLGGLVNKGHGIFTGKIKTILDDTK